MKSKGDLSSSNYFFSDRVYAEKRKAFNQLFEKYWKELYFYAFNILKSKSNCEDIIQDIFIDYWNKADQKNITNPRAYLYKAVKFQTLNHIRRDKIQQKHLDHLLFSYSVYSLEDEINHKEMDHILKNATDKLPDRCREIFELSRIQGLSNKEISHKLNISNQTIKNQISLALKHLRKALNNVYVLFLLFIN